MSVHAATPPAPPDGTFLAVLGAIGVGLVGRWFRNQASAHLIPRIARLVKLVSSSSTVWFRPHRAKALPAWIAMSSPTRSWWIALSIARS